MLVKTLKSDLHIEEDGNFEREAASLRSHVEKELYIREWESLERFTQPVYIDPARAFKVIVAVNNKDENRFNIVKALREEYGVLDRYRHELYMGLLDLTLLRLDNSREDFYTKLNHERNSVTILDDIIGNIYEYNYSPVPNLMRRKAMEKLNLISEKLENGEYEIESFDFVRNIDIFVHVYGIKRVVVINGLRE